MAQQERVVVVGHGHEPDLMQLVWDAATDYAKEKEQKMFLDLINSQEPVQLKPNRASRRAEAKKARRKR